MDIPFRLVDVFCERPFEGNQLCVVPEPLDLDDEMMQTIAREIGFSETTFVQDYGGDRYSMRIFTPGQELPFAGHPTLGTAFVMVAEGRVSSPLTQLVRAGEVPVEVDLDAGSGRMRQLPPVFGPEFEDLELVAAAVGLRAEDLRVDVPVQTVSTGLPPLIVPVRDLQTLRKARRDGRLVGEAIERADAAEIYLFAVTDDGVTARMFDAESGVGEDPATGSAAGPLGAYLALHSLAGMPGTVRIRQGEQVGRPSLIEVDVEPEGGSWRVLVGGGVRIIGEGRFGI